MSDKDNRNSSGPCPTCRRDFAQHTDAEVVECARSLVAAIH